MLKHDASKGGMRLAGLRQ